MTEYMPKSLTPNDHRIILEVYNETIRMTNILMYNMAVFLAIRLLLSSAFCIKLRKFSFQTSRCTVLSQEHSHSLFFPIGI